MRAKPNQSWKEGVAPSQLYPRTNHPPRLCLCPKADKEEESGKVGSAVAFNPCTVFAGLHEDD